MQKSARKKGFTLIELLVVIAIIGVLAAVVLIAINPAKRLAQARDSGRKSDVGQIATAAQAFYVTSGRYPTTLAELTVSGDLKTKPSAPATGNCAAADDDYTLNAIGGATAQDLIVSVCIESPTTVPTATEGLWAWCSSPGTAKEYTSLPGAVPCT